MKIIKKVFGTLASKGAIVRDVDEAIKRADRTIAKSEKVLRESRAWRASDGKRK